MELIEVLAALNGKVNDASQPTDLRVGTVVSVDPLKISINSSMAPLESGVLYLTSAVTEKKLSLLSHTHSYSGGTTGEALSSVVCYENGEALPVEDGYIFLNRGLALNDKVLLLRVQKGQKFIVLSRVM